MHDSGIAINPIDVEGQIVGGVAMGLGAALGEEITYERGAVVNPAFVDYAMPRAADVPPVRPILVSHADPMGPHGAKGVGEIALNPTAAAVANAVAHATGIRIRDLPITPDKVLMALLEREGRSPARARLWRRPARWWVALVRWAYPRGLHELLHRFGPGSAGKERREVVSMERPSTVVEATATLRGTRSAQILAGGTDLMPARAQGLASPLVLVDVNGIEEMSGICEEPDGELRIGGAVTLERLLEATRSSGDDAIRAAVETIASVQIRNVATVAGNLCQDKRCSFYRNGFNCYKRGGWTRPCYAVLGDHRFYHAAVGAHRCQAVTPSDLATVLTAMDGRAVLASPHGRRVVPMTRFYRGPGEPALEPDEVLAEIRISGRARDRMTRFEKLRLWQGGSPWYRLQHLSPSRVRSSRTPGSSSGRWRRLLFVSAPPSGPSPDHPSPPGRWSWPRRLGPQTRTPFRATPGKSRPPRACFAGA